MSRGAAVMAIWPPVGSAELARKQAQFLSWDKACERALLEARSYAAIGNTSQAERSMARYERMLMAGPEHYLDAMSE